ncbi:MAG: hypothetical protein LBS09_02940 [Bacteroidales bacterium]|jgi:hypothetical protein|nr:hypothetical protein [Bacteroidales bacterium]
MKKNTCISAICIIACVAASFSCDKTEIKPIREVIVGKWVFDNYTVDDEQLKRDFADILYWMGHDTLSADFERITEFTANGRYLLYGISDMPVVLPSEGVDDEGEIIPSSPFEKGTYAFEGDVLSLTNHSEVKDGFPFPKAQAWANNNDWITLSAKISDYVDVEYIITTYPIEDQELRNRLRTGNIQVYFKRYAGE